MKFSVIIFFVAQFVLSEFRHWELLDILKKVKGIPHNSHTSLFKRNIFNSLIEGVGPKVQQLPDILKKVKGIPHDSHTSLLKRNILNNLFDGVGPKVQQLPDILKKVKGIPHDSHTSLFKRNIISDVFEGVGAKLQQFQSMVEYGLAPVFSATPHNYPYMAFIYQDGDKNKKCGGALISNLYILTSASCAKGHKLDVILGAQDVNQVEQEQQRFSIAGKDIYIHENYTQGGTNDIALVKLPKPLAFTKAIRKAELPPNDGELYINENATYLGWQRKNVACNKSPIILKYSINKIVSNDDCESYSRDITDNEICASQLNKANLLFYKPSNHFDDQVGGPLIVGPNNLPVVVGIATQGDLGDKIVFTRISKYRKWIESKLSR